MAFEGQYGLIYRVAKQVSNLHFIDKKNLGGGGSQATTLVLSGGCLGSEKPKFGPSNWCPHGRITMFLQNDHFILKIYWKYGENDQNRAFGHFAPP